MLIQYWMSRKVITVDPDSSMNDAAGLMKIHGIHMLPVARKGSLMGVVTSTDISRASASDATSLDIYELLYLVSKIKVKEIMSKPPITLSDDQTVEEAAELLRSRKISGAPVLNANQEIVGVITKSDIFSLLISLTHYGKRGIQFGLRIPDRFGAVRVVEDAIRERGGRILSIFSSADDFKDGYRNLYIRFSGVERPVLEELKNEIAQNATLLYMVDHRENVREIY